MNYPHTCEDCTPAGAHVLVNASDDEFCSGILHVFIGEGTKLRNPEGGHLGNKVDPYLYIKYNHNVSISDVHRKTGSTCQFNWHVQLPFNAIVAEKGTTETYHSESEKSKHQRRIFSSRSNRSCGSKDDEGSTSDLEITVFDQNTARPDLVIGKVCIPSEDILKARGAEQVYQKRVALTYHRGGGLTKKAGIMTSERVAGWLEIEVCWERLRDQRHHQTTDMLDVMRSSILCESATGVISEQHHHTTDSFDTFRSSILRKVRATTSALSSSSCLSSSLCAAVPKEMKESFLFTGESGVEMPFPIPCLRLVKNKNHIGGLLRELVDGGKLDILRTWQIHLWGVHDVFGEEVCGWNRNYHAAQQIYGGSTPDRIALREAIRAQHHMLYHHESKFKPNVASHTFIRGMRDFIQAIPDRDLNTSTKKSLRFTYVITTDSLMNFSVTSAMTGRDFLSKHALHANAMPNVVYSGEFFVDRSGISTSNFLAGGISSQEVPSPSFIRFVIDNNSGTFAPPKERLGMLYRLLRFNFGKEIPILTLDRDDELLKHLSKINNVE